GSFNPFDAMGTWPSLVLTRFWKLLPKLGSSSVMPVCNPGGCALIPKLRRDTLCATSGPLQCPVRRWAFSRQNYLARRQNWPYCASLLFRPDEMARRKASPNLCSVAWGRNFWTRQLTHWWREYTRAIRTSCPFRKRSRSLLLWNPAMA